ncbi:MAG: hypothetical protein WD771_05305 [Gemmatimonadaceae bacterium]
MSPGLTQKAHQQLIGYLGLLLPFLIYGLAGIRPTDGLEPWQLLPSVSAYYHTGAVGMFVGVLFALALFLVTYRGYKDDLADRRIGKVAGLAAIGVALFPTTAPDGVMPPTWWSETTTVIHYVSAVGLFICFIVFAVWLFRKSSIPARADRPPDKRRRDDICLACGIVMILAVLWAASSMLTGVDIFWPETVAIIAFAVSWLVKGEAPKTAMDAMQQLSQKVFAK